MKHSKLLTLALVCAFCAPAYAQESLLDIYQRALQNDPAIREAEMSYRAAAEIKPQTRSGLLPSLNLSSSRNGRFSDASGGFTLPQGGTSGSRTLSRQSGQSFNIGLTQTLFDWSLYAQLEQADKRVVRAEMD